MSRQQRRILQPVMRYYNGNLLDNLTPSKVKELLDRFSSQCRVANVATYPENTVTIISISMEATEFLTASQVKKVLDRLSQCTVANGATFKNVLDRLSQRTVVGV